MANPRKELRLRVMAEYASSGIWVIESVGSFRHGMISHASLHLPPRLAQAFEAWIERYYDRLESEGAVFDIEAFNAEGLRLAKELKAFLGADVSVEFTPEDKEAGIGPSQDIKLDGT